jgi:hypothetical protein
VIAVGDLGAVLRWVGLLEGPAPPLRRMVSADALLGEVLEYLKVRYDSQPGAVSAALAEIHSAVDQWYPTGPVAGRLAELATTTTTGIRLDATLLAPVAVAAETGLALATTSEEIADLARPHVPAVVLL